MRENEAKDALEKILKKADAAGASYADARFQQYDYELVMVENKALKTFSSRRLSGIGVRVALKGSVGYASISDMSKTGLERVVSNAVKAAGSVKGQKHRLSKSKTNKANAKLSVKVDPANIAPEEKVSAVLDANKAAMMSSDIKSALTMLGWNRDSRVFMSSEGAEVSVQTTILGVYHESVAKVDGVMERVPYSNSKCAGFEYIKSKDWNLFTADISKLAVEAAGAKTPPPGTYSVVVHPEVVGVLLHEAFGHASEGDLVSTGESVLNRKLGTQLASRNVTIADKGLMDDGYFYPYDDEGNKKEETIVVRKGVLKNYILDRESAAQLHAKPTGNGRAMNFENIPIVRQTNYYMYPGGCEFEELIEDLDSGIYVMGRGMTGGEVEVGMGTFTFGVGPSKMIKKGELAETVRGVVISGLILETLKTTDALGKDLTIRTNAFGGCGKNGQTVPVGFGGPHFRVRMMSVGGR